MNLDALQSLDVEAVKDSLAELDPEALIPQIDSLVELAGGICRICLLAVPLALLLTGLAYLLFAPREANYIFGYRTAFGMGSVSAWRHTQKIAGAMFSLLGLVLLLAVFLITAGMGNLAPMDMVWKTVRILIGEGVLVIAARLLVNTVAMATFNYRGERRRKAARTSEKH